MGELLGRGGMAEVFAGHAVGDHGFQKPVAIKRLLPELANDEVFVERLIEEAKLLVGMQHGNIVSVLDLAREGDDVFLVMEFVDGPSLRQLIKARGPRGISLGVATYIAQSAAAGLEFAHARPGGAIIHADISPSNLLLTTSGEVRVADFGIARREGLGEGVVEGKWAYMAPEQARGEALTPRSDVFALGVVLYELLTGQHPFGRVVAAHQRDEQMRVIPPRVVKPSIPAGLDALCMRALAHDPRDRYARMQQLIDELVEERFAHGYREAASDLAQAIREVAPPSEIGAPRTMHTDRPLTIVTRSLLPDALPPRPGSQPQIQRASSPRPGSQPQIQRAPSPRAGSQPGISPPHRPSPSPSPVVDRQGSQPEISAPHRPSPAPRAPVYPIGFLDPPPRDAFPAQPTMAVETRALAFESTFAARPRARAAEPQGFGASAGPAGDLGGGEAASTVPPSGEHTAARTVDQVALAQAASVAAALMQQQVMLQQHALRELPARADGTPLPPFRSRNALGDELASVVGGHTVTGQSPGMAIDFRSRWTLGVLALAALIGVAAAVAIHLTPDVDAAPAPVPPIAAPAPAPAPTVVPAAAPGAAPAAHDSEPTIVPPRPAPTPTFPSESLRDSAPPTQGTADPAPAAVGDPAASPSPAAPTLADQAPPLPAPPPAAPSPAAPAETSSTREPAAKDAVAGEPAPRSDAPRSDAPAPRSDAPARRSAQRDGGKRKVAPGYLRVNSTPWSWVSVGGVTKETPYRFTLAPGTYRVTFRTNDGLVKVDEVTITSGAVALSSQRMDL